MDNSLLLRWVFLTLARGQSYLEAALTSWSHVFIQIGHKNADVLCIRKHLQRTNPLSPPLVRHVGIEWVFPGEMAGAALRGGEPSPGSGPVQRYQAA